MRTNLIGYALSSEKTKKILRTLLDYPQRQWTCSSLEEAAKLSHATVFRTLTTLREYGLLRQFRLSRKMVVFELVQSPLLEQVKTALEAEKRGLKEIAQELVTRIKPERPIAVILYGSVAENKIKPGSDIDLLVLIKKSSPKFQKFIYDEATNLSLKYNQTISPMIFTEKEFLSLKRKRDKFILNVLKGEKLYGKAPL